MKIHAIQTGTVALTTKWREGVGHGRLRLVNTLLDRERTEPLPIYAFAIEHPEGVIVVDTGETAGRARPRDRSPAGRAPDDRSRAGEGDRMITFQTSVRVKRPIEEVFALVSDPHLFPRWNSAVQTVHQTSEETGTAGSTYSMQRQLPTGEVENELEVLASEHPTEFSIRTTSGPTPFRYRYRFASDGAHTIVRLDANVELTGVTSVLGPLAARGVRRGVDANLATLKHTLETNARHATTSKPSLPSIASGSSRPGAEPEGRAVARADGRATQGTASARDRSVARQGQASRARRAAARC